MQSAYTAGGMRLPGIGQSINGRIHEREEMARAAPDGDNEPEAIVKVSYVQVMGFRHPFGVRVTCNPWELPDRVRTKLNHCASVFLRTCGRRIKRPGDAMPEEERES